MSDSQEGPRQRAGSKKYQIVDVPHRIKDKVSGGGPIDPQMLAKAEAAVQKLSDEYPDWAGTDVQRLQEQLDRVRSDPAKLPQALATMFSIAHDLRGQGGSFGYPLITEIGRSLCRITYERNALDDTELEVVGAHIDAMRAVIGNKVRGDGGQIGRQIAKGLDILVERHVEG